jgi:hypothetical protein
VEWVAFVTPSPTLAKTLVWPPFFWFNPPFLAQLEPFLRHVLAKTQQFFLLQICCKNVARNRFLLLLSVSLPKNASTPAFYRRTVTHSDSNTVIRLCQICLKAPFICSPICPSLPLFYRCNVAPADSNTVLSYAKKVCQRNTVKGRKRQ